MHKLVLVSFSLISVTSAIFLSEDIKASIIKALSPALPISPIIPSPLQPVGPPPVIPPPGIPNQPVGKSGCPLCDRSVYSYCYDKMAHDACCCNNGNAPYNCFPDDCSYLNAKSCPEHFLIVTCCCNNPYH